MQNLDGVILERLKRPHPKDSSLVPFSTPVVSFGDPSTSKIVTIGINPSCVEFESKTGLLTENKRRLEDFRSLKIADSNQITDELASRIHAGCLNYFSRKPYGWFNQLDKRINLLFDSSYYAGTSAHLDLVQWATNPVWSQIKERSVQASLLHSDADFLRHQLTTTSARFVYLSGEQVFNQMKYVGLISAEIVASYTYLSDKGRVSSYSFYKGETFNGIPVGGWSRVMPGHYVPRPNMDEVFTKLTNFLEKFRTTMA